MGVIASLALALAGPLPARADDPEPEPWGGASTGIDEGGAGDPVQPPGTDPTPAPPVQPTPTPAPEPEPDPSEQSAPGPAPERDGAADVDFGRLRLHLEPGDACGPSFAGSATVVGLAADPQPSIPDWAPLRLYVGGTYPGADAGGPQYCIDAIGDRAFAGRVGPAGLTAVTLDDSVRTIGAGAFDGDADLVSVFTSTSGAGSLTQIDARAFAGTSVESLDVPDSVQSIGDEAFAGSRLSTLQWNWETSGLHSVGGGAFADTHLAGTLALPRAVEQIGARAFATPDLQAVTLTGDHGVDAGARGAGGAFDGFAGVVSYPEAAEDGMRGAAGLADLGDRAAPYDVERPAVRTVVAYPLINNQRNNVYGPVTASVDDASRTVTFRLPRRHEYTAIELNVGVAGLGVVGVQGLARVSDVIWQLDQDSGTLDVVGQKDARTTWTIRLAYADPVVTRDLAGATRYDTTCGLAQEAVRNGQIARGANLFLATGENYPDAVVASGAAAGSGGWLLLTPPTGLPQCVQGLITQVRPSTIYVIGGYNALPRAITDQLSRVPGAGVPVRIKGEDRVETSGEVFEQIFGDMVPTADHPFPDHVFLVSAQSFPDAITAASAAAYVGGPVLLVRPGGFGLSNDQFVALKAAKVRAQQQPESRKRGDPEWGLDRGGFGRVHVIGGKGALDDQASKDLKGNREGAARWYRVDRIAGRDRYETAAMAAVQLAGLSGIYQTGMLYPGSVTVPFTGLTAEQKAAIPTTALLATGEFFADGVSAAPYAKELGGPVLLSQQGCVPDSTLLRLRQSVDRVRLVGGPLALSANVQALGRC